MAVTGIFCGYVVGTLWPNFMSASNPGPMFMMAGGDRLLLWRGLHRASRRQRFDGSEHRDQRDSDFGADRFLRHGIGYRMNHAPGSVAFQLDSTSSEAYNYRFATTTQTANGKTTDVIVRDANMVPAAAAGRGRQTRALSRQLSRERTPAATS